MATHSRILTWRIPWTEEPGGLQSKGSQSQTQLKQPSMHLMEVDLKFACGPDLALGGKVGTRSKRANDPPITTHPLSPHHPCPLQGTEDLGSYNGNTPGMQQTPLNSTAQMARGDYQFSVRFDSINQFPNISLSRQAKANRDKSQPGLASSFKGN